MARFLVVIRDDFDRTGMLNALRLASHSVLESRSVSEALAGVDKTPVDCAIIDFGFEKAEIAQLLASLRQHPETRIVAAPLCESDDSGLIEADYPILKPNGLMDILKIADELFVGTGRLGISEEPLSSRSPSTEPG